jgi:hypothetical protein
MLISYSTRSNRVVGVSGGFALEDKAAALCSIVFPRRGSTE